MYSQHFDAEKLSELISAKPPSAQEVDTLLQKPEFDVRDLSLLMLADESSRLRVMREASCRREKMWQNRLFLVPPLYISSGDPKKGGCFDHCVYCPWRHGNVPANQLRRLNPEEVREEATHLLSLGYGDIELVAATDPELLDGEKAARMVAATKKAGAKNVGINFFPVKSIENYTRLAEAGCTFTIVWQETYCAKMYEKMHPRGPKSNMQYRLDAHDRALQGGVKTVGVAFLGGLSDWGFDALATLDHALYLRKAHGANIIFGMPRWKDGSSGIPMHAAPAFYGDKEYELVGALYSLAIPEALPWFSTREHFELSAQCAKGGGCMFTLDCSTEVGGYTKRGGFGQFPVYSRSFKEGTKWLQELGFKPEIHLPW